MKDFIHDKFNLYSILSVLLLKSVLEIGYIFIVSTKFEYQDFYLNMNIFKFIESTFLTILLLILLLGLEKKFRPSIIVIYILFINLYIPISILYWLTDKSRIFYYFSIIFLFILIFISKQVKLIQIPQWIENKKTIFSILIFITVLVYGYLIFTGGLTRINFNLLNVYETREDYVANNIKIFGYLVPWQANIINMFFLVYGFFCKNNKIIFTSIGLQLLLFAMTNFKSFLFAPLVVIAIYIIFKSKFKEKLLISISVILSSFLLMIYIIYFISNNTILVSIFVRRLFFVPANLHYLYYDFFSNKEKYYLSKSILEGLIEPPYPHNPVTLVSLEVYGKVFSPNVGIIADAYLNFGVIGIILFSIILGLYLWLLDSVTQHMKPLYTVSLIVIPSISLVNSALFTTFLTHGLIIILLLLWLTRGVFNNNERKGLSK